MQPMPAMMNDRTMAGPACWAAARPVRTKMPMPIAVSATGPSDLRSSPLSLSVARSWTDLTASRFFSIAVLAPLPGYCGAAMRGTLAEHSVKSEAPREGRHRRSALAQTLRNVRRQQFEQRRVHLRGAGDDVAFVLVFAAVQAADHAAGFGDQQGSGRGIPGREAQLPECVQASGRDISQIERR